MGFVQSCQNIDGYQARKLNSEVALFIVVSQLLNRFKHEFVELLDFLFVHSGKALNGIVGHTADVFLLKLINILHQSV